jgi:hypothetical protein
MRAGVRSLLAAVVGILSQDRHERGERKSLIAVSIETGHNFSPTFIRLRRTNVNPSGRSSLQSFSSSIHFLQLKCSAKIASKINLSPFLQHFSLCASLCFTFHFVWSQYPIFTVRTNLTNSISRQIF